MEDSRIIELFYARSEQAITELAGKYGKLCGKVAGNILNNSRDAEECVNDAYLGVWNTIPPQRPQQLAAYLCRIVRNLSVAKYHANTAKKRNSFYDAALEELEECISSKTSVEDSFSAGELARLLDVFLDTLPQRDRVMFVRRYWYSDSAADIAKRLGGSSNSVSVQLSRIRGRLRKFLQKEGYVI